MNKLPNIRLHHGNQTRTSSITIRSNAATKVKLKKTCIHANNRQTNIFYQQQYSYFLSKYHTTTFPLNNAKYDESHNYNDHEEPLSHLSVEVNQNVPTNGFQLSISVATRLFQLYTKLLESSKQPSAQLSDMFSNELLPLMSRLPQEKQESIMNRFENRAEGNLNYLRIALHKAQADYDVQLHSSSQNLPNTQWTASDHLPGFLTHELPVPSHLTEEGTTPSPQPLHHHQVHKPEHHHHHFPVEYHPLLQTGHQGNAFPLTDGAEDTEELFSQHVVPIKKILVTILHSQIKPDEEITPKCFDITELEEFSVSNRAVRHIGDPSRFITVLFRTESYAAWKDPTCQKIARTIMEEGITTLDGRKFSFLSYSSSGLRTRKIWFFEEKEDFTVETLRHSLGDFTSALSSGIAKYAARLGHAFSASVPSIKIEPNQVKMIDDVITTNEKGEKFTHTDGCGLINEKFAKMVAEAIGLKDDVPSAFQIRYGGYKGVVVNYPFLDHPDTALCLRPSMKKFDCNLTELEILNYSRGNVDEECASPSSGNLNKQIINLLHARGVPYEKFEELLDDCLMTLHGLIVDNESSLKTLNEHFGNPAAKQAIGMLKAGYNLSEPRLWKLVNSIRGKRLEQLRTSMKIPLKKARYLLGVCDETGFLKPNEIFVNIANEKGEYKPLVGPVITTRNPCLHPGDIQIFQAVDSIHLRRIKNCVVFPVSGNRSATDMMSGGDVDGDLYFVCWDHRLLPTNEWPPADYSSHSKEFTKIDQADLSKPIKSQLIEFFLKFHANNVLGKVVQLHDIACDYLEGGAASPTALQLAAYAAVCVDSAKNGKILQTDLRKFDYLYDIRDGNYFHGVPARLQERIKHFLEQEKHELEAKQKHGHRKPDPSTPFAPRPHQHSPESSGPSDRADPEMRYIIDENAWIKHKEEAMSLFPQFNREIAIAIHKKTEIEEDNNNQKWKKIKTYKANPTAAIYKRIRDTFHSDVGQDEELCKQKASAWYFAVYEFPKRRFGVLWAVTDYLNKIKAAAVNKRKAAEELKQKALKYSANVIQANTGKTAQKPTKDDVASKQKKS